jgi:hypothetical protein
VIAADPNTAAFASAIQAAFNETNPLSAPTVAAAYVAALKSIITTLANTSTSSSTPQMPLRQSRESIGARASSQRAENETNQTASSGEPAMPVRQLDPSFVQIPSPQSIHGNEVINGNFVLNPQVALGRATGWLLRVSPLNHSIDQNTVVAGTGSNGQLDSPPGLLEGEVTESSCTSPSTFCSFVWLAAFSYWDLFNLGDLISTLVGTATQSLGLSSSSQVQIPATQLPPGYSQDQPPACIFRAFSLAGADPHDLRQPGVAAFSVSLERL